MIHVEDLDWTHAVYVGKDSERIDNTVERVYHLRNVDTSTVHLGQSFYLHDGYTWRVSLISDMGRGITAIQLRRNK